MKSINTVQTEHTTSSSFLWINKIFRFPTYPSDLEGGLKDEIIKEVICEITSELNNHEDDITIHANHCLFNHSSHKKVQFS